MTTPTIASLSPIAGHTGGRTLVEIDGTGFRLPSVLSPVRGIVPESPPSVRVTFGGVPALEVRVVSTSLLYAITPIANPGTVDVTVTNIDDAGSALSGQSVTQSGGYTFALPDLTAESDLTRVIRAFMQELKRQILPNVSWPASVDYDDDTQDMRSITKIPKLPGLVLAETTLKENDFYALREPVTVEHQDGTFTEYEPPTTVDVMVTLVGVSNSSQELLNLSAATKRFFRKNAYLAMARDPNDPSKGSVQYELTAHESPDVKLAVTSNDSDIRHFSMTVSIIGFDIEQLNGLVLRHPGDGGADREAVTRTGGQVDTVLLQPTTRDG